MLSKTLGVPLFQEQAMRIAMVAAGFTAEEADQLRRAMAAFRKNGTMDHFGDKLIEGMMASGYEREFAERCFHQIGGFGEYGFPESHAASFALLVYVSAWLKHHYPAAFACALLNSQPMGFYAPAQIVRDASEHGVAGPAADVNHSDWDCTLELPAAIRPAQRGERAGVRGASQLHPSPSYLTRAQPTEPFALRLGLRQVKGLHLGGGRAPDRRSAATAMAMRWRSGAAPRSPSAAWRRCPGRCLPLHRPRPARGALGGEGHGRHAVAALRRRGGGGAGRRPRPLPRMGLGQHVSEDYASLHLSLKQHPLALLRASICRTVCAFPRRVCGHERNGTRVGVAGLVLVRQRPGTASGVIFATLEDETGVANLVIWPKVFERFRRIVMMAAA